MKKGTILAGMAPSLPRSVGMSGSTARLYGITVHNTHTHTRGLRRRLTAKNHQQYLEFNVEMRAVRYELERRLGHVRSTARAKRRRAVEERNRRRPAVSSPHPTAQGSAARCAGRWPQPTAATLQAATLTSLQVFIRPVVAHPLYNSHTLGLLLLLP